MTIQEASKRALEVQNACNLSGVVRSFAKITETLWAEARSLGHGTDWVNRHPISVLFASKIDSLTGAYESEILSAAIDACEEMAGQ